MGGTSFSRDDYDSRQEYRSSTGTSAFTHDTAVKAGKAVGIHPTMDPYGVKLRESRDSAAHPVTVPIALGKDFTGSMRKVPEIFQAALGKLMGHFLEDKASGKKYLGDGYPAILIGGFDDYAAMQSADGSAKGTVQVGQFESGLEIDDDLGRLWITGNGGGTGAESYQLYLYFIARHTAHDHWDKRRRKGFLFLFGDEESYPTVRKSEVQTIFGDEIPADIPVKDIIRECQERYHVFFVIPNMTSHYGSKGLETHWRGLVGDENVLLLDDPNKICELIVSTVALFEETATLEDLMADNVATGLDTALVPLSRKVGEVSRYDATGLPATTVVGSGTERI